MRRSEFLRAVEAEFGSRARFITADLSLGALGGLTADEAMREGLAPRVIWLALCEEAEVPAHRRYGVGRIERAR